MKIKNFVFGLAIIIVTIAVVVYGINTFYPGPEYEDFCEDYKTAKIIETQQECETEGGKWDAYNNPRTIDGKEQTGYCNMYYYCQQDYETADQNHARIVFLIALPLGIAIILLGAFGFGLESVGAGLMGGGVGTILYGIGGYWRYTENWLRFILSLVGLIVLIWVTYYFNNKFGKKK